MNRKCRLNYIKSISQLTERKKMYKAKKQWVIAGISFLVATGLGAMSNHLITHASQINTKQPITSTLHKTSLTPKSLSSTNVKTATSFKNIQGKANTLHQQVLNNVIRSGAQSSITKTNVVSSSSRVISSANNNSNAFEKPETNKNTPMKKLALGATHNLGISDPVDINAPRDYSLQSKGMWGKAHWSFYNNGQLDLYDGDMQTPATPTGFSDSKVLHVKTYNVIAPQNMNCMFARYDPERQAPQGARLNFWNIQDVDLSGMNTDNVTSMAGLFHTASDLKSINFGHNFNTSKVTTMASMFDDDVSLKYLDMSSFDTRNVRNFSMMFWDMPSLRSLDLSNFKLVNNPNVTSMLATTALPSWTYGNTSYRQGPTSHMEQIVLSPDFRDINTNGGQWNYGYNQTCLNNAGIGDSHTLYNTSTRATVPNWNNVAQNPGNYINNSDKVSYTINYQDELTNGIVGSSTFVGLKNSPFVPIDSSEVPSGYQLASNAGTTAKAINNNTAITYVMPRTKDTGAWGNANWSLMNDGQLILNSGALETNQVPQKLVNDINQVTSIVTKPTAQVAAPGDASNLLDSFSKAKNIDLSGMDFSGTSNVLGLVNPDANVIYPNSFYEAYKRSNDQLNSDANDISQLKHSLADETARANQSIASESSSASLSASSAYSNASSFANSVSTSLNNRLSADERDINNISGIAQGALTSAQNALSSLSGVITNNINNNATSAENLLNSYNALNSNVNGKNGISSKISNDEHNIDVNTTGLSTLNSSLNSYYSTLSADVQDASTLASSANTLADKNSNAVNNLKSNTAITLTFMNNNSQVNAPITLTKGYIEANGSKVNGTSDTYDVTKLLNLSNRGYYPSDYQITISSNANGVSNMKGQSIPNNSQNISKGNKKFALGAKQSKLLDDKSAKNVVHLTGVPIQYKGTITLNFKYGDNTKTIQIPYTVNTRVGQKNINVLNNANFKESDAQIPQDYQNRIIQDFDTHNFSYQSDSGNYEIQYVNPNEVPSDYDYSYITTVNHNGVNPTVTFSANQVSDTVQFMNGNNKVGSDIKLTGVNDTQGSTKVNNIKAPKGYQLINSDTRFIYSKNGVIYVPVISAKANATNSPANNKSNVPNSDEDPTKPQNKSNAPYTVTITINDYDAKGKNIVNTYNKYVVISSAQGSSYSLSPSDYLTTGYNLSLSGKPSNANITGTVDATGISTKSGVWDFYANPSQATGDKNGSKSANNGKGYKPQPQSTSNGKGNIPVIPSDNSNNRGKGGNTPKPTPVSVPSDITSNPSGKNNNNNTNDPKAPNNPHNATNSSNTKYGYATIYIIRKINGKNKDIISTTVNENNNPIGYHYDIKPSMYVPNGYEIANDDKDTDLTGFIQADGSLSNGTATFYYDVNPNQIAPMEVIYQNSDGDYINYKSGSDLGNDINSTKTLSAIQNVSANTLAKLGAVGDTVNIYNNPQYIDVIHAPKGYYISDGNDYTVKLTSPKNLIRGLYVLTAIMPSTNYNGEIDNQTSAVNSDVSKAKGWTNSLSINSSTKALINNDINFMNSYNSEANQYNGQGAKGSSEAQYYFNLASAAYTDASYLANSAMSSANNPMNNISSDELSAFASEVGSHITVNTLNSTSNNNSALSSLTAEVSTNNSEINSLANKPVSTQSTNSNNFDALVNNGLSKLTRDIKADLKTKNHSKEFKHIKRPNYKHIRNIHKPLTWVINTKSIRLYRNLNMSIHKSIILRPNYKNILHVRRAYVINHHIVFKVAYKNHNYYLVVNKHIKDAYLNKSKHLIGKKIEVLHTINSYKHKAHDKVRVLHRGLRLKIKRIVVIGHSNVTRLELTNNTWISANRNYVKVL